MDPYQAVNGKTTTFNRDPGSASYARARVIGDAASTDDARNAAHDDGWHATARADFYRNHHYDQLSGAAVEVLRLVKRD